MKKISLPSVAVILSVSLIVGLSLASRQALAQEELIINWAQWAPADYLEKLSQDFTAETGIKVIVEQTPWETFVQKYNTELIAKSDAWDIIVGDSQEEDK